MYVCSKCEIAYQAKREFSYGCPKCHENEIYEKRISSFEDEVIFLNTKVSSLELIIETLNKKLLLYVDGGSDEEK